MLVSSFCPKLQHAHHHPDPSTVTPDTPMFQQLKSQQLVQWVGAAPGLQ